MRGLSMTGAAWLAALAALHAGAGRVMLALLDEQSPQGIAPWPEIMLRRPAAQDWSQATVVCGCGGGEAVQAWLPHILAQAPQLVLDADALNAVAASPALAQQLSQRAARQQTTVLTPTRWRPRACCRPALLKYKPTAFNPACSLPANFSARCCSRARARLLPIHSSKSGSMPAAMPAWPRAARAMCWPD
jgi:hypothetical protein